MADTYIPVRDGQALIWMQTFAAGIAGSPATYQLSVDGVQIGGLITPGSDTPTLFTVNFTVAAGDHTIRFEATDSTGDKTTFIDLVTLTLA